MINVNQGERTISNIKTLLSWNCNDPSCSQRERKCYDTNLSSKKVVK